MSNKKSKIKKPLVIGLINGFDFKNYVCDSPSRDGHHNSLMLTGERSVTFHFGPVNYRPATLEEMRQAINEFFDKAIVEQKLAKEANS